MKKIITLMLTLGFISLSNAATNASAPVTDDNETTSSSKAGKTVVVVASSAGSCADGTPCEVIKSSAQTLSDAVNQNISEKTAISMIQNSIVPQIDFTIMSRLAMGAQWKQATPDQQTQIVGLFKQMLVYSYTNALSKLKGAQVSISSSTISGEKQNKAIVNSSLKMPNNGDSNNQPINIEYDLAKIGSAWKIYDVKIEKVSIVTTYRTQFNDEVQKEGITGLITQLQTKVNNLKGNK
ncbi:MAG: ABC transporter substrate-binding protein [Burkholderiales bacterium]|nr:ABC transporter substrate-binding protein [Burkholderiales bacterium]